MNDPSLPVAPPPPPRDGATTNKPALTHARGTVIFAVRVFLRCVHKRPPIWPRAVSAFFWPTTYPVDRRNKILYCGCSLLNHGRLRTFQRWRAVRDPSSGSSGVRAAVQCDALPPAGLRRRRGVIVRPDGPRPRPRQDFAFKSATIYRLAKKLVTGWHPDAKERGVCSAWHCVSSADPVVLRQTVRNVVAAMADANFMRSGSVASRGEKPHRVTTEH